MRARDELIVDLFAGGGGASLGIELATGRQVDIAVNHDPDAISMHEANHPETHHYVSDVFEVDPVEATKGRPVGLLWASPDCTYFSKARGSKPFRDPARKRRALATVVTRWARTVRPRVIMLENVEEFTKWGPVVGPAGAERPCPKRRGHYFRRWVRSLERLGYVVEWREQRASWFGAPTSRKRLFLIARCDRRPIVWPEPTHGPKRPRPYRTAAECIDWSVPMCSIFATRAEAKAWGSHHGVPAPRRPLAEATMRRIAKGVERYVLENPRPYIVPGRERVAAPYLVPRYGERPGQEPRTLSIEEPHPVVVPTGNGAMLVSSFLARHWGGMVGKELEEPYPTVLTKGAQDQLVTVELARDPEEEGALQVAAFLQRYNGQGVGQGLDEPALTLSTRDRLALVTVTIRGEPYVIVDIAMRMLVPRELFRAQGFPDGYQIERGADGRRFTRTTQVRLVGNSVSPPHGAALVAANLPELVAARGVQVA